GARGYGRRDPGARGARRRADAAGVCRVGAARRDRRGRGGRLRLRVVGRGPRRSRPCGRRRPAPLEGDDGRGSRARGVVAVIVDYHMHLRDPDEAIDLTVAGVERFVETAAARGVDEIGFTEHVYYFRQTRPIWTLP